MNVLDQELGGFRLLVPVVAVDGTVLVASMGATVAAATGVMVLKIGFCKKRHKKHVKKSTKNEEKT